MSLLQALFLGLLQGSTEFLPVSSSGHLVLIPWLLGWPVPGLAFDTLVHWGTAVAVVAYFWREWLALVRGVWRALTTHTWVDPDARLALLILIGTVPGALAGMLLEGFFESAFARPAAAAGFLLVTAGVLTLAERATTGGGAHGLSWLDAVVVGLAQAVAILPGISRSGATIAAGMWRGLARDSAARFSFLLATPIIVGAGLLQLADLGKSGALAEHAPVLVVGFLAALVSGLAGIQFLMRYLKQRSLYPFALYCAVVGLVGLIVMSAR